ncbi:MAG TPA: hypothetical protein VFI72_15695 [Candidatus Angelobacter sp.]|nr:hypothetical protein [Candidatus Angelobacter sp.]
MADTRAECCNILGLGPTASVADVKAAFQRLVTDFHSSGKPKNIDHIDDVEYLRRVVRAYHALSENTSDSNGEANFGYDSEALERYITKLHGRT